MADYSIIQEAVRRGYSMDEIADKLASDAGYDPACFMSVVTIAMLFF